MVTLHRYQPWKQALYAQAVRISYGRAGEQGAGKPVEVLLSKSARDKRGNTFVVRILTARYQRLCRSATSQPDVCIR